MIRLGLLTLFIAFLALHAWRDWYKSLCGLIVLMAVIEHPDMPKSLLGIQGLNPWNIGFLFIGIAWFFTKGRDSARWDMPRNLNWLLLGYLLVVGVSFLRMALDPTPFLAQETTASLTSEYLVNSVKWVLPGMLLFLGCRSEERFRWGLAAILLLYFLLAVQVIRWMPLDTVTSGEGLRGRSLKIILNEIGYHRVNMSMMLAGASWAIFASRPAWGYRTTVALAGFMAIYAQALTGGRTGYGTWGVVGVLLCLARPGWRKFLTAIPVVAVLVVLFLPGVKERMTAGFTPETRDTNTLVERTAESRADGSEGPDAYTVTAGRNVAWPFVVEKIRQSPLVGYGRLGMIRTGTADFLEREFGELFPHPHNAYLEQLLDNGLAGFVIVIPFYAVVLRRSLALFRTVESPTCTAAGGVSAALVLALLVASFGSQTFYPREGSVGMWCAIGLMLRVHLQARSNGPVESALWRPLVPAGAASEGRA